MPTNKKEYMKLYFRQYVKNSDSIICDLCFGKYKRYNKHRHIVTLKHLSAEKKKRKIIRNKRKRNTK